VLDVRTTTADDLSVPGKNTKIKAVADISNAARCLDVIVGRRTEIGH
jgi:hypothetical protein